LAFVPIHDSDMEHILFGHSLEGSWQEKKI
jgi:hypothetical protein